MHCSSTPGYFYPLIDSMSVIIILLAASIAVAALFLAAFLWGVKSGQFEDDYSPASRILFDDKPKLSNPTNKKVCKKQSREFN